MKTLFVLLVMLLTGCGQDEAHLNSDPELDYYLRWYLRVAPNEGKLKELSELKFGEPPVGKDGYCDIRYEKVAGVKTSTKRVITIKPLQRDSYLAALVMHELGHCLHDFQHIGEPRHIMSELIETNTYFWDANLQTELERLWQ